MSQSCEPNELAKAASCFTCLDGMQDAVQAYLLCQIANKTFGAGAFLDLTDAPHSYAGQAGTVVSVKLDESGLEFTAGGGGGVPNTRQINTTSPLSGGGDLSVNRTLSIANAKADSTTLGAATFLAADFDDNGAGLISIDYANGQKATVAQPGFLTAADWATFNGKQAALGTFPTGEILFGQNTSIPLTSANFFWSSAHNRLGINNGVPAVALDVTGQINATTGFLYNGTAAVGTVLRGNATNYVASTFTIPDTFVQGDILYASAASVLSALAKDANATRYLANTGTNNNPAWAQIALGTGVSGQLPLANGGTGANLSDPGANRLWGWDDTDNAIGFWTIGTGLSYVHASHTLNTVWDTSAGVIFPATSTDSLVLRGSTASIDVNGTTIPTQFQTHWEDAAGGTGGQGNIGAGRHSNVAGNSGNLYLLRSRGTSEAGAAIVANGDQIGALFSLPYDGVHYQVGSAIVFNVDGVPGVSQVPTNIILATVTSSGTLTPGLTVRADQTVELTASITSGSWAATNIGLGKGGTGASLSDPGANRLWGWDDTDNAIGFWTIGTNLSYDHATHTLSATGGSGSPAGANFQLQFYSTGAFGADSNLNWDNTNKYLQLGTTAAASRLFLKQTANDESGAIRIQESGASNTWAFFLVAGGVLGIRYSTDGVNFNNALSMDLSGNLGVIGDVGADSFTAGAGGFSSMSGSLTLSAGGATIAGSIGMNGGATLGLGQILDASGGIINFLDDSSIPSGATGFLNVNVNGSSAQVAYTLTS